MAPEPWLYQDENQLLPMGLRRMRHNLAAKRWFDATEIIVDSPRVPQVVIALKQDKLASQLELP